MKDQMLKKTLITTSALVLASGKAAANPVRGLIDTATLKASAESFDQISPDDFDQVSTDDELAALETIDGSKAAALTEIPENTIYRIVKDENGTRYIPVEITGIKDRYAHGEAVHFELKEADGSGLTEHIEYYVKDISEQTEDGLLHTMTFYSQNVHPSAEYTYYGSQSVTFMEDYLTEDAKEIALTHKLHLGTNDCVRMVNEHTFTPEEDGTYRFTLDMPEGQKITTFLKAVDGDEDFYNESTKGHGVVTADLKAGKTYAIWSEPVVAAISEYHNTEFDMFVDKVESGTISVTPDEHGNVRVYAAEQNRKNAGDYVLVDVYPDDGYYCNGITYTAADGSEVKGSSSGFYMPACDVTITADIRKGLDNKMYRVDGDELLPVKITRVGEPSKLDYVSAYELTDANGKKLNLGTDFGCSFSYKETSKGTLYTISFSGNREYKGKETVEYLKEKKTNEVKQNDTETNNSNVFNINIENAENGRIMTYKMGRSHPNDNVTSREKGKDVDIRVYPDEGYYLKDIVIVTDNNENVRWYDDDTYSLGFRMPSSNVTIKPVFEKIDSASNTAPETGLYRETAAYNENGKRSGEKLYIPVTIEGIDDTYNKGTQPEYTVKTADGTVLKEGTDYTVNETVEETDNGTVHTLTFEGKGAPKTDSSGYLLAKTDTFKGKQVITYTEKDVVLQQQINITKADHGKVETYKIGRTSENDKVTERDQGKDVDIKVLPDEGYYLKDIQIVSDTDQTIRWYDDENYSLGFTMPEGNVTITPVFEKIDASYKTIPENSMYRQVYGYNGGRDGNRYYIPVEIKGINTSYDEGQKPEYTVKAADGTALTEGTDYTVNETVKETSDGILHTLTFEGIGGYSYDDGGYLKAKTNIFSGKQVITYTEKKASAAAEKAVRITTYDANGKYTTKAVFIKDYNAPIKAVEGYTLVGWTVNDSEVVDNNDDVRALIRSSYEANSNGLINVKPVYEKKMSPADTDKIKILTYDHNGDFEVKAVYLKDYKAPDETVEGYTLIGWTLNDSDLINDEDDLRLLIRSRYEKNTNAGFIVKPVYEKKQSPSDTDKIKIVSYDHNGNFKTKAVYLNEYKAPNEAVEGYTLVGWTLNDGDLITNEDDLRSLIRSHYEKNTNAGFIVKPVYEKNAEEPVIEEPVVEEPVIDVPSAEDTDYAVTFTAAKDQGYSDYVTGNNVFTMDFSLENPDKKLIKGGVIEFEFNAPIGRFLYGADIGSRNVTVDPTDPRKVRLEFSTYDPNGVNTAALRSYLAISTGEKVSDLKCVSAKVISIK